MLSQAFIFQLTSSKGRVANLWHVCYKWHEQATVWHTADQGGNGQHSPRFRQRADRGANWAAGVNHQAGCGTCNKGWFPLFLKSLLFWGGAVCGICINSFHGFVQLYKHNISELLNKCIQIPTNNNTSEVVSSCQLLLF